MSDRLRLKITKVSMLALVTIRRSTASAETAPHKPMPAAQSHIGFALPNVRFRGKADMTIDRKCPLMTKADMTEVDDISAPPRPGTVANRAM
jgi:hypothetical protein